MVLKLLALLAVASASLASGNLVSDPGFENGAPVAFEGVEVRGGGWRLFAVGGADAGFSSVRDPHTGDWALSMVRRNSAGDTAVDRGMPDLLVPIQGNRVYMAGVWAKSEGGSSLTITLASHDIDGGWTGKQVSKTYPLGDEYAFCGLTMKVAAGVEVANLAFRVEGTGEITLDDAVLADATEPPRVPAAPKVTWPTGGADTLAPTVAWASDPHDAYHVLVRAYGGNAVAFDSGEVASDAFTARTRPLPANRRYLVRVRVRNAEGWSPWSPDVEFGTPRAPFVTFEHPMEADGLIGPDVAVRLRVESEDEVKSLRLLLNGEPVEAASESPPEFTLRDVAEGLHQLTAQVLTEAGDRAESSVRFHVGKPVRCPEAAVYLFDLRQLFDLDRLDPAAAETVWDTCHAVATLQGIVNRDAPRLYLRYQDADEFWWSAMRERGGWLEGVDIVEIDSLEDLVHTFRDRVRGAVVYDRRPASTSNVASTIAGAESLVAVRYSERPGSVYMRLVEGSPVLPVAADLRGRFSGKGTVPDTARPSTGSAKCDAYAWAVERYLKTGKTDPLEIAYYQDSYWLEKPTRTGGSMEHTLLNHDFGVARRGFFCDLSVWGDEAPLDDPAQPLGTDLATLEEILRACWEGSKGGIIHFSGFTPWAFKYTTAADKGYKHEPVPTEWETARLISAYNAFLDADACGISDMANASFFTHLPLPEHMPQQRVPTRRDMRKLGYLSPNGDVAPRNFVLFYNGDWDSAAWVYRRMPGFWDDPARGELPMNWALNPNLIARMPLAFYHCYRTAEPCDHFIAGDAGAGYLNVTQLTPPREPSGLPSGTDAWVRHCARYYRRLNYSITGFLLNGSSGKLTREAEMLYSTFSPDGVMAQPLSMRGGSHLEEGLLVAEMLRDIGGDIDQCADQVASYAIPGRTQFVAFRAILRSPTFIRKLTQALAAKAPEAAFAQIGPYEFFYLQRHALGQEPRGRATYTFDTIPRVVRVGEAYEAFIGVRNDGWDTWRASSEEGGVPLVIELAGEGPTISEAFALPHDVGPGEGAIVHVRVTAPARPGDYTLRYSIAFAPVEGDATRDCPFEATVTVMP